MLAPSVHLFFFFNDTATTEIYTLSLHDALPISARTTLVSSSSCLRWVSRRSIFWSRITRSKRSLGGWQRSFCARSEEHTSELQSRPHLVCRLLLEKKKNKYTRNLTACVKQCLHS